MAEEPIENANGWAGVGGAPAPPGGRFDHVFAAIDLGTNNCRLLVARPEGGGFRVVDAFSRIVRLGEGVSATGVLSAAAMDRAVEALTICAEKMARRGVTRARAIATQACRLAHNGHEFVERVRIQTGLSLDVIASEEEAMLAAAGCASLIDDEAERVVVFDIGGGSTEIVALDAAAAREGRGGAVLDWISMPLGVVTMAERHGGVVVPRPTYERMVEETAELIAPFLARGTGGGAALQLLGTSGTVTTLAGIHLGLARYDRAQVDGLWMGVHEARGISERLLDLDHGARVAEPCIGPERADLVIGGCAILEAILRAWPTERLRIADRGLREGVLHNLMAAADAEAAAPPS